MKLSIIIPVWNTGKSACELIKSLLPQYDDMEIIAINDGSTDDSLKRLQELAKTNKRIKVLTQENAGQSVARNAGIKASKGEFLCFIDSDDKVADDYIPKILEAMTEDAIFAVCGMKYVSLVDKTEKNVYVDSPIKRGKHKKTQDYVLELLIRDGRLYSAVNKIFRGEIIRDNNLSFEVGRAFAEDTNFVLDYIAACNKNKKYAAAKMNFLLETLYIYYYGTETSTVKKVSTIWENWQRSYDDLVKWCKKMSGGKISLKTWVLLGLIYARWQVSYRRSKRRFRN